MAKATPVVEKSMAAPLAQGSAPSLATGAMVNVAVDMSSLSREAIVIARLFGNLERCSWKDDDECRKPCGRTCATDILDLHGPMAHCTTHHWRSNER